MSASTIQPLPSDPTDIQHRLAQIELQLQPAFAGSSASAFYADLGMSSLWILDSGASYQMTSTILSAITPLPTLFLQLQTVDDSQQTITQIRSITSSTLTLSSILHVSHLCINLISISSLCEIGLIITFDYFTLRSYYTSRSCLSSSSCYI